MFSMRDVSVTPPTTTLLKHTRFLSIKLFVPIFLRECTNLLMVLFNAEQIYRLKTLFKHQVPK